MIIHEYFLLEYSAPPRALRPTSVQLKIVNGLHDTISAAFLELLLWCSAHVKCSQEHLAV